MTNWESLNKCMGQEAKEQKLKIDKKQMFADLTKTALVWKKSKKLTDKYMIVIGEERKTVLCKFRYPLEKKSVTDDDMFKYFNPLYDALFAVMDKKKYFREDDSGYTLDCSVNGETRRGYIKIRRQYK